MNNICDLPYSEIELDQFGNLVDPLSLDNIAPAENLFVMVHGWNSDIDQARALYTNLFTQFSRTREASLADSTPQPCAVLGVFWPSEKDAPPALVPGDAACLDPEAQREFIASLRALLPDQPDDEGARELLAMDGAELLGDFEGGAEVGAAHIGDRLAHVRHALHMLNSLASYHLMKDRAGIVGRTGLARALDQIQDDYPGIRIHLAGHSFGCRVITSAAAAVRRPVASMTLLQAAFSHNSFSPSGGFRAVVADAKCDGPIAITHSVKDEAVGICYPLASRILRQSASSFGGANDRYGALGRNGARHTPEASDGDLLPEGSPYAFAPGLIYNLQADDLIQAHSDIVKPETAWALISAAGLGA